MIDRDGYRPNVGIILCNWKNEVFWGKRVREHAWQFPQGGIKQGESPETAVLRELGEETGQDGQVVRLVEVSDNLLRLPSRPGTVHAIRIVYEVRVSGGQLHEESEGTTDACSWFTLDEARRLNLNDLAERALRLLAAAHS